MSGDQAARNAFGALAFLITGAIIAYVLSKFVPDSKESIANVVLGNVLGWPGMVLAYFFGSSSGSKAKDMALAEAASEQSTEGKVL